MDTSMHVERRMHFGRLNNINVFHSPMKMEQFLKIKSNFFLGKYYSNLVLIVFFPPHKCIIHT